MKCHFVADNPQTAHSFHCDIPSHYVDGKHVETLYANGQFVMPSNQEFTLIIEGSGPWEARTTAVEARRMAAYVELIEGVRCQGRCATCAFRTGTPANGSSMVVRVIEMCVRNDESFRCHMDERECAGFTAFKKRFTR